MELNEEVRLIDVKIALSRAKLEILNLVSEVKFHRLIASIKANFNPAQPRDGLGRWVIGGGAYAPVFRAGGGPSPRGHHFVARAEFENRNFSAEARRVFDTARTGPLSPGVHGWSPEHARYNAAVGEHLDRFLARNSIRPEQMTADQARSVVEEVRRSADPRIRDYNLRIYRNEIIHAIRRRIRSYE